MRGVLIDIGFFLLPSVLFWLYLRTMRRLGYGHDLPNTPWVWLTIAGLFLAGAATLSLGLGPSHHLGEHYEPAHVENGRLVPAETR